jgi:hypothetical protein
MFSFGLLKFHRVMAIIDLSVERVQNGLRPCEIPNYFLSGTFVSNQNCKLVVQVVEFSREGYTIRYNFREESIFSKEVIVFCELM